MTRSLNGPWSHDCWVYPYLEDKGIPSSQLSPQGFGKTHFVASNRTAEGRAQIRRVELVPEQQ